MGIPDKRDPGMWDDNNLPNPTKVQTKASYFQQLCEKKAEVYIGSGGSFKFRPAPYVRLQSIIGMFLKRRFTSIRIVLLEIVAMTKSC